jgi:hypothetical protein
MQTTRLTHHARDRATARQIPPAVMDIIVTYGEAERARDGACKYALSRASMRQIRKDFGREISKALERHRKVCVVETGGLVLTAFFTSTPLFH